MEVAVAAGLAALGYGIGTLFPNGRETFAGDETLERPSNASIQDATLPNDKRPPTHVPDDRPNDVYETKITDQEALEYDFKQNVPEINPGYEPVQVLASNDDMTFVPDGLMGIQRENQPFFSGVPGTYNEGMMNDRTSAFTGVNNVDWRKKEEAEPRFEPPKDLSYVFGRPVDLDESRARALDSLNQNPRFEGIPLGYQKQVGPGLNIAPNQPAAYGFHDPTRVLPPDHGYKRNQFGGKVTIQKPQVGGKRTKESQLGIYKRANIEADILPYAGGGRHMTDAHKAQAETHTIQCEERLKKKGMQYNETGAAHRTTTVAGAYVDAVYEELLTNRDDPLDFTAPAGGIATNPDKRNGEGNVQSRVHSDYKGVAHGSDNIRGKESKGSVKDRMPYKQPDMYLEIASKQLRSNPLAIRPLAEIANESYKGALA